VRSESSSPDLEAETDIQKLRVATDLQRTRATKNCCWCNVRSFRLHQEPLHVRFATKTYIDKHNPCDLYYSGSWCACAQSGAVAIWIARPRGVRGRRLHEAPLHLSHCIPRFLV